MRFAACAAASRVLAPRSVSTSLKFLQQLQRPHVIWQYPAGISAFRVQAFDALSTEASSTCSKNCDTIMNIIIDV